MACDSDSDDPLMQGGQENGVKAEAGGGAGNNHASHIQHEAPADLCDEDSRCMLCERSVQELCQFVFVRSLLAQSLVR